MIEIIPINYEDVEIVKKIKIKDVYVTSLPFLTKMLHCKYPIKNQKIAIKSILDFIEYIDIHLNEDNREVQIHNSKIDKFFNHKTRNKFLQLLSDLNIVKRVKGSNDDYYKKGEYSCSYTLSNEYRYSELCFVLFNKKVKKSVQLLHSVEVDKKFKNTIKKAEINVFDAVRDEIKEYRHDTNKLRSRISKILSFIRNDRFIKKGIHVDRIYHSLSNISRISRNHVTVSGKKFFSIDIVNSQPILLCYLLSKENKKFDKSYQEVCEAGYFYESFGDDIIGEKRDKLKIDLFRNVLYKFQVNSQINKQFKELYPLTWSSLNELLNEKSVQLARLLQNIEAEVINDIIPQSEFYFTLFDGIYFTSYADKYFLERKLNEKFSKFDIRAQYKVV
jgi:hypothetical protein